MISSKAESILLFFGDLLVFALAFWLALFFRAFSFPDVTMLEAYGMSFVLLSAMWVFVFFVAGLYEKATLVFEKKLPSLILNAQIANSVIAAVFFYAASSFVDVAPKTVLVLYFIISTLFIIAWRLFGLGFFGVKQKEQAILIGAGEEVVTLKKEINLHKHYNLDLVSAIDLAKIDMVDVKSEILERVYRDRVTTVIVDIRNEKGDTVIPTLYNLLFSRVRFLDIYKVYEEVFGRIPLSLVRYNWFLENISSSSHMGYDILKRFMDLGISVVVGIFSLVLYPFVALAIYLDDKGSVFIVQDRIGKYNTIIKILKFRSMAKNDAGEMVITRVGRILRATRIDELPQLWNVIKGDLSLVGPRPELPNLVKVYEREIPYYSVRHLVTPGLSGWGQIKDYNVPRSVADIEKTRTKLSYDLYYIKNRSFLLDVFIALKTIKTILSRSGS